MAHFKYDVVTLIEAVESKPSLWDKTREESKNKILREKCWLEVCEYLEDRYTEMNDEEKKKTREMIMVKWANVRDSFMRSLRTKSGQAAKRNYIYGEHLQFLLKVALKDSTDSNFSQNESILHHELSNDSEISESSGSAKKQKTESMSESSPALAAFDSEKPVQSHPGPSGSAKKLCRSKRELNNLEEEILSELKKNQARSQSSDHETLLLSFLPYIRDMNEVEMMDFQMETLTLIKKIKQKRVLNTRFFPSPPHSFVRIRSTSGDYQNVNPTIAHHSPSPTVPANYTVRYQNLASASDYTSPYQSPEQTTNTTNRPSPLASDCTSPCQNPEQEQDQGMSFATDNNINIYQTLFDNCAADE